MTAVASAVAVEILTAEPVGHWAGQSLRALRRVVPHDFAVCDTTSYQGGSDWLIVWGPGEPVRAEAIRRQVASGGHAVAIDLAYWSRPRKVRISIDAPHPQAWVMRRPLPASRLEKDRPTITNLWKPRGHIVIAGIGCKAQIQYGARTVDAWETAMAAQCRKLFPDRVVVRRPKKPVTVSIEQALRGASLVITWHSNVAVDAIRFGIPVVCRDGAAAAVCPSEIPDDPRPLPEEVRAAFLRNLSFFQWDLAIEAADCWAFLRETLA